MIDTGANINLIDPKFAHSYEHSKPYKFSLGQINSANSKFSPTYAIDINFFHPKIDFEDRFLLHHFHNYFYGIIGNSMMKALDAIIDLGKDQITLTRNGNKFVVPISYYSPLNHSSHNLIRTSHLSKLESEKLKKVLEINSHSFYKPDTKLTCTTNIECAIHTTDNSPVHQRVYPYPAAYADEVNKQVEKLLEDGIIRPSHSAWTSPVWIVPKKSDASGQKKIQIYKTATCI